MAALQPDDKSSIRTFTRPKAVSGLGLAVWAAWGYVVIAVGRLGEIVPGLGNIPIAKAAIGIALLSLFASKDVLSKTAVLSSQLARNGGALLLLALVTVPFSVYLGNSIRYMMQVVMVVMVGFILVFKIGRNWSVVRGTLLALVTSASVLSLAALASYSGGRIAAGTSYDPNDLAYVAVTVLPIAIGFAVVSEGKIRKMMWGICGLLVVTSLLTQSRGGLIALGVIIAAMIFKPISGAQGASNRWLVRFVLIIAICSVGWTQLPEATQARFETLFSIGNDYNMDADNRTGRTDIWKRNLKSTLERPIGFGIDSFTTVDSMTGGKFKAAHNSAVQVTVELGWLGIFLFLMQYRIAWRQLTGVAAPKTAVDEKVARELKVISRSLRLSLITNFVAGFFLSQAYSNLLWVLFAVIAAMVALPEAGAQIASSAKGRIQKEKLRRRTI